MKNYYKLYKLSHTSDSQSIKKVLDDLYTKLIHKLNHVVGNPEREYTLRKELETLEEAMVVFKTEQSRESYDDQLTTLSKEGMLSAGLLEEKEEVIQEHSDDEKLEKLMEKIIQKQQEVIKKKEKETLEVNEKVSNERGKEENQAEKLLTVAEIQLDQLIAEEGIFCIDSKKSEKVGKYIEDALMLDATNYKIWLAKYRYLLHGGEGFYSSNFFEKTWLNKKYKCTLTKEELNTIEHEKNYSKIIEDKVLDEQIEECLGSGLFNIVDGRCSSKKIKELSEKYQDRGRMIKAYYEHAQSCQRNDTYHRIFDKLKKTLQKEQITIREKLARCMEYEKITIEGAKIISDNGRASAEYREDIFECYENVLNLAPIEKKQDIEQELDYGIEKIYNYLIEDFYKYKEENMNEAINYIVNFKNNKEIHKLLDKEVEQRQTTFLSLLNKKTDLLCLLLIVLGILMLFIPYWGLIPYSILCAIVFIMKRNKYVAILAIAPNIAILSAMNAIDYEGGVFFAVVWIIMIHNMYSGIRNEISFRIIAEISVIKLFMTLMFPVILGVFVYIVSPDAGEWILTLSLVIAGTFALAELSPWVVLYLLVKGEDLIRFLIRKPRTVLNNKLSEYKFTITKPTNCIEVALNDTGK